METFNKMKYFNGFNMFLLVFYFLFQISIRHKNWIRNKKDTSKSLHALLVNPANAKPGKILPLIFFKFAASVKLHLVYKMTQKEKEISIGQFEKILAFERMHIAKDLKKG